MGLFEAVHRWEELKDPQNIPQYETWHSYTLSKEDLKMDIQST